MISRKRAFMDRVSALAPESSARASRRVDRRVQQHLERAAVGVGRRLTRGGQASGG
jgi:hypothetical protein